jgi:hypothetical protein
MLFILRQIDHHIDSFKPESSLHDWIGRKNAILKPLGKISSMLKGMEGFSILGAGLNFKPAASDSFEPLTRHEEAQLCDLLQKFGGMGHRLRIVVDDPDRLFTRGATFDPQLLAGYILGANWIANQVKFVQFIHVLKSSVYDALRSVEEMANLPHDYFRYLGWNSGELRQLIEARLRFSGVDPGVIFDDVETYSVPLMSEKIRNGPRDLLRYMEIILKSSGQAKISAESIVEHEAAFKVEARRQMESVYSNLYFGIDPFIDSIFPGTIPISVDQYNDRFHKLRLESRPAGVDYSQQWLSSADRSLRVLIDAGLIEFCPGGQWVRPYDVGYSRFNPRLPGTVFRRSPIFA